MQKVLTTQSTVTCGHQLPPAKPGKVQVASTAKLRVNGNPVLLESGVVGKPVSGCATPTSQGNVPCTAVKSVSTVPPPKLTVNGDPVLVEGITGETFGQVATITPQSLLSATANQSKLSTT
jgi:hypothetical protein